MNEQAIYQAWLEKRRSHALSPDLADDVILRIERDGHAHREARTTPALLQRMLDWISLRPLAKAAVLVGGGTLAAVRLFATLQFLLMY